MATVTLEGEVESGTKQVKDGRLWLGKEFEGKTVEYAVKVIDEEKEDNNNE